MELVNALIALVIVGTAWALTVEVLKLPTRRHRQQPVSTTEDAVEIPQRVG